MGKISKIYSTFNKEVDADVIADCSEEVVNELDNAINSTALARLSETGLKHLTDGLKDTYLSYLGIKQIRSTLSEEQFKAKREELISQAWRLRQYFGTDDFEKLTNFLSSESGAIYTSDLNLFMMNEEPMLKDTYREVRNYLLAKATSTEDTYSRFLIDLARHATWAQKSTGYFPDVSKADPGIWSHGEGWSDDGWGNGGWGHWWN